MTRRLSLALAATTLLASCVTDLSSHPDYGCEGDADCAPDQRCDRGFCVTRDAQCGAEIACNLVDDDCDGETDELDTLECDTGRPGACAVGALACLGGLPSCAPPAPTAELCNGIDDDCDVQIDELPPSGCFPDGASGCADLDGDGVFECEGVCAAGEQACVDGEMSACVGAVVAVEERCEPGLGRDEDCDGMINEGCACTEDQVCYGGPDGTIGVGACHAGTQACAGGTLAATCEDQRLPMAETCANPEVDDDCDGVVDDVPDVGSPCVAEAVGACRNGSLACVGTELACEPSEPRAETCNGEDDDCDGVIDESFDTNSDPMHCGACGNACGGEQACCGGVCTDTRNDAGSCGACGNACAGGDLCCGSTCRSPAACGVCAPSCTGSDTCCGGTCADTQTDESHCGACGNVCGAGQVCCGGACVGSTESHCGDSCSTCSAGSELCCAGACVAVDNNNCNACGVSCSTGDCCDTGCVDLDSDRMNCGGCNNVCATGDTCSDGHCCPTGQIWCDSAGACVDPAGDEDHCGGCDLACGGLDVCCGGRCRTAGIGCAS